MPQPKRPYNRFFAPRYVVLPIVAFFAFWGFYGEQNILIETHETIEVSGLAPDVPPMRVAVISDLHVGSPNWGLSRLKELVERVNAAKPDLILIAGDFSISNVIGGRFVAPADFAPTIANLDAPLGIFSVMGNHDWIDAPDSLIDAFQRSGLDLIDGQLRHIIWHGETIDLIGIPDDVTQRPDIKKILQNLSAQEEDRATILLTHNPGIYLDLAPEMRLALMLAGHTHGGQVNIPFFDPVFMPTRAPYEWAHGLIETKNGPLFVTSGVGTSIFPVRFNQPPEIAILTLVPPKKAKENDNN